MLTEMRAASQTTPGKEVGQWEGKSVTQIIRNE